MLHRRFQVLDSWRGICAVLVALHHLPVANHIQQAALVRNAWLFVDFFFVLSGFVLTHAYGGRISCAREALAFLIRRVGRLWPLHLAILGCFIGLEIIKLGLAGEGVQFTQKPFTGTNDLAAVPANALLLHSIGLQDRLTWNGPSWSISAELMAYIAFAAVSLWAPAGVLPAVGLALGSAIVVVAMSPGSMDVTYDLGTLRCLYGFFVGSLTYRLWKLGQEGKLPGLFGSGHERSVRARFAAARPSARLGR